MVNDCGCFGDFSSLSFRGVQGFYHVMRDVAEMHLSTALQPCGAEIDMAAIWHERICDLNFCLVLNSTWHEATVGTGTVGTVDPCHTTRPDLWHTQTSSMHHSSLHRAV